MTLIFFYRILEHSTCEANAVSIHETYTAVKCPSYVGHRQVQCYGQSGLEIFIIECAVISIVQLWSHSSQTLNPLSVSSVTMSLIRLPQPPVSGARVCRFLDFTISFIFLIILLGRGIFYYLCDISCLLQCDTVNAIIAFESNLDMCDYGDSGQTSRQRNV